MDTSRRAVESYWRSRMIDGATSDEDKVTPVYKLEEICELLKSSPAGIVKEVSEFVLKRLDHKSPIVKQKALRLIKYSVGKSGGEFRREMQRHSVAVKQLLHYKGQPDPLKGDALNKAVRETAQDALSAIFSTDDGKPTTTEVTHKRMEGFGNTNYAMPSSSEKKSFLTEVVDLGSASIKQGLSSLAHAHSFKKNDVGSYRGPTLQRSLNNERDDSDRYEKMEYNGGNQGGFGASRDVTTGTWRQDRIGSNTEVNNGDGNSGYTHQSKTREERFLETIVTSGGVRLQPTRDALHAFVSEACKMDQMALCRALHSKLQAPHWQVRVKAVCVVEAFLRKKDYEYYDVIASYFIENVDVVIKCSESPQASLREKANRVLSLMDGGHTQSTSENTTKVGRTVVEMPDLIDTGDNDLLGVENPNESQNDHHVANKPSSTSPLIDDLFGDATTVGPSTNEPTTDDDPFADVSFHSGEDKDLFAGMTIGEDPTPLFDVQKSGVGVSDPFDIFGSLEPSHKQEEQVNVVDNLMSGLSFKENGSTPTQKGTSTLVGPQVSGSSLSGGVDPLKTNADMNAAFPMGGYQYNVQPGMLFNQFYPSQNVNYGGISGLLTQQQIMAAMGANFQTLGSMNSQNGVSGNAIGAMGANPSPIPDIFNANMQMQTPAVVNTAKKEETKAFDFISDHLSAARDPKRVT